MAVWACHASQKLVKFAYKVVYEETKGIPTELLDEASQIVLGRAWNGMMHGSLLESTIRMAGV